MIAMVTESPPITRDDGEERSQTAVYEFLRKLRLTGAASPRSRLAQPFWPTTANIPVCLLFHETGGTRCRVQGGERLAAGGTHGIQAGNSLIRSEKRL